MELSLVDTRDMVGKKAMKKAYIVKSTLYTEDELRRFAQMTIKERVKFCQESKKVDDVDKCVCEAMKRWLRLFKDFPMEGSKELGRLRVAMVENVFEEMKKNGKIKCTEP